MGEGRAVRMIGVELIRVLVEKYHLEAICVEENQRRTQCTKEMLICHPNLTEALAKL